MAVKKINHISDELDILELLKKWWSFRKLIIFGTLIIGLVATFILILANEAYLNKKQTFVTAVLKSDLGDQSSLILYLLINIINCIKSLLSYEKKNL